VTLAEGRNGARRRVAGREGKRGECQTLLGLVWRETGAFGLYDMAGNVWQWTEDCYDNNYAGIPADGRANETPASDVHANDSQGKCLRVDRGGSWMFPAWLLRSATRERNPAGYRNVIMGFRVAKTLP
jgi:formylglycine-generating enzyme required for sulfatase activity